MEGTISNAPANQITDQGLSVVYDPPRRAIADIVFVHGLQGHPFRTWASTKPANPRSPPGQAPVGQEGQARLKTFLTNLARPGDRRLGAEAPGGGSSHQTIDAKPLRNAGPERWFWPRDSVPTVCPEARVLTWGYDTVVSRLGKGPACRGSISSHGRDLLWDLERARDETVSKERPLIFVAHSLGGIVVKEMLSLSERSARPPSRRIVKSTAAIIFLGTPHRGSVDLARLANKGRSIISALGFDTASAALDALGLRSTDLERCQESFSSLWRRYDFRVKTFQESLGMSGINIGPLNDQVVQSFSSLLGDDREDAETLHANHTDLARFSGPDDSNQAKVVGEIRRIYSDLRSAREGSPGIARPHLSSSNGTQGARGGSGGAPKAPKGQKRRRNPGKENQESESQKMLLETLETLHFDGIEPHRTSLRCQAQGTCQWIFAHPNFDLWRRDSSNDATKSGLLWILGHPGSGKSTVMEEAYRNFPCDDTRLEVFAFFFDSKAKKPLLCHPSGLYRSLLYQIFSLRPNTWGTLDTRHRLLRTEILVLKRKGWETHRYQEALEAVLVKPSSPPTVLFIDGLHECGAAEMHDIAMFFSSVTKLAQASGVQLRVCLASRAHGAPITAVGCPVIWMEHNNASDIKTYVHQRLSLFRETAPDLDTLIHTVLEMSRGIFLWVVLAVDSLARDLERGLNVRFLQDRLLKLPGGLHDLYREILIRNTDDRKTRLRFFQWVIFGGDIQLREWRDILPFLGEPLPRSLRESQRSQYYADTDEQLIKLIRDLSLGLVHVTGHILSESQDVGGSAAESIGPAAGSLNSQEGNTRIVGVIHETVRKFFLDNDGFLILSDNGSYPTAGDGYETVMNTCLDLIQVPELDPIVERRLCTAKLRQDIVPTTITGPEDGRSHRSGGSSVGSRHSKRSSVGSYHSAGSLRQKRAPVYRHSPSPPEPSAKRRRLSKPSSIRTQLDQRPADQELLNARLADFLASLPPPVGWNGDQAEAPPDTSNLPSPAGTADDVPSTNPGRSAVTKPWDYPDCMPYIIGNFADHASRGHDAGMDPTAVVSRLRGRTNISHISLFKRLLVLGEAADPDVDMARWARDRFLLSWLVELYTPASGFPFG